MGRAGERKHIETGAGKRSDRTKKEWGGQRGGALEKLKKGCKVVDVTGKQNAHPDDTGYHGIHGPGPCGESHGVKRGHRAL